LYTGVFDMKISKSLTSSCMLWRRGVAMCAISFAVSNVGATDVAISIGGEIKPGVYGRVDIGTRPPPPVMYPQPVVIVAPPRQVLPATPVYMHVPHGHAKKWEKHCHKYNACGQPVYFVKGPGEHGHGEGQGHSNGRGKDKRDRHDH
jgi:hypothetical protein